MHIPAFARRFRLCLPLGLCALLGCSFQIPVSPASCTGSCVSTEDGGAGKDQPPMELDPGRPGPLLVASFGLSVPVAGGGSQGRMDVSLFGPGESPDELRTTGSPHPLVVISPGQSIVREQYRRLGAHLASWGLVAVVQSPRAEWNHQEYRDDTIALMRWLLAPSGEGAERVRGKLDGTKVGLVGHGLGGKVSLLVAVEKQEGMPRIHSLFLIDPADSAGLGPPLLARTLVSQIALPPGVPVAYLGEPTSKMGTSCVPKDGHYEVLFGLTQPPAYSLTLTQGAYGDFVDDPATCGPCQTCPTGLASKSTRELMVKYASAYLLLTLKGQTEMATYVSGAALERDSLSGMLSYVRK